MPTCTRYPGKNSTLMRGLNQQLDLLGLEGKPNLCLSYSEKIGKVQYFVYWKETIKIEIMSLVECWNILNIVLWTQEKSERLSEN